MSTTEKQDKPAARRSKIGTVGSISGDKTVNVTVSTLVKHPRYGKYVRQRTKLAVHCPGNDVNVGDVVEIIPCRRLSKSKAWRLSKVVRRIEQGT
jgi:small subunit ribosomal protein S17